MFFILHTPCTLLILETNYKFYSKKNNECILTYQGIIVISHYLPKYTYVLKPCSSKLSRNNLGSLGKHIACYVSVYPWKELVCLLHDKA